MTIKVYGSKDCPYCKQVKKHLKSKKVSFEYIDLEGGKDKIEELMKKTGGKLSIPATCKDGKCVIGWDKQKIDELIK